MLNNPLRSFCFVRIEGNVVMTTFERIKKLTQTRGISLKELAEKLNFGESTIYKWKTQTPKTEYLELVADFFDVSVDYLLGREEEEDDFKTMSPDEVNGFLRVDLSDIPEEDKDDILEELNWYKEKLIERAIKEAEKRKNGHTN